MKRWKSLLVLPVLVAICPATVLADEFRWPKGEKAAVSLSYDDALHSQLDYAVPALNEHGIKASFYLMMASPVVDARLEEWRVLAAQGHELGNHTLFHACSASVPDRAWVAPHNDMDKRTIAQMQEEIATANSFLKAIDGKSERTFTPPCIETITGDGDYLPAVQDLFVAIKGAEQKLPEGIASYLLPNGQSGKELIAFVKDNATKGGIVNIIFHGVGGDHLAVSADAHAELIRFLANNRDAYWTDTYVNIMTHVNQATVD